MTENIALKNLQLETLREAVADLDERGQKLIFLRYDEELSMEEIGRRLGVSRMAISKRLRTLHRKLNRAVS
ncbi:MAG: sigma-70 family RNA polymerase sigma factor [Clostridiales bacterium]|nr:sigma-70 family RNA polymerase sigma factor [Clostridiales bacterium]